MRDGTSRRHIRELVREHNLPRVMTFSELTTRVEKYRGTSIQFRETPVLNNERICGAWTGLDGVDTVHLPLDVKPAVKLFIACHELGHMLAEPVGRETRLGNSEEVRAFLHSVLNTDRVIPYALRGVTHQGDQRESEAELLGHQLAVRVLRAQRTGTPHNFRFETVFAK